LEEVRNLPDEASAMTFGSLGFIDVFVKKAAKTMLLFEGRSV